MTLKSRLAAYRAIREREKQVSDEIEAQQARVRNAKYIVSKDNPFDPNHKDTLISVRDRLIDTGYVNTDFREIPFVILNVGGTTSVKFTTGQSSVESSSDGKEWHPYPDGKAIVLDFGNKVYFRGTVTNADIQFSISGGSVSLAGNLMSLLTPTDFQYKANLNMSYQFSNLFENCTSIVSAKDLWVTASILTDYCYNKMFAGCTNLTEINDNFIPVVDAQTGCFQEMFSGCTNLKNSPVLHVKSPSPFAFYKTFEDCVSLINAKIDYDCVEAGESCFEYTASNCRNLKSFGNITKIARAGERAFWHTFEDCVSLEVSPVMNFIELGTSACNGMYYGCSSLNEIWIERWTFSSVEEREIFTDWCIGVSDTGVFHGNKSTEWPEGQSGNPWPIYPVPIVIQYDPIMGTVTGPEEALPGEIVRFDAIPKTNYHFLRWDDGSKVNPRYLKILAPTQVTGYFESDPMAIKVTLDTTKGGYRGPYVAKIGDVIRMEIVPNHGYTFEKWSDGSTDNPRIETVTKPIELSASFVANTYTVSLGFDIEKGIVSGPTSGRFGDILYHTATPSVGYKLSRWNDDQKSNPHILKLEKDTILVAEFEKVLLDINIEYDDLMGEVEGPRRAYIGDQVKLTARPKPNYAFKRWDDGSTDPERILTITGEMNVTAEFTKIPATIEIKFDPTMGTVEGPTEAFVGDYVDYTAIPIEPYEFDGWADGNKRNPRTVYIDKPELTIEALFV